MNASTLRPSGAWLFATAWLAGAALALGDYQNNLDKSFPASPGGKLVVKADRGSIDLTTRDTDQVVIKVWRTIKEGSQANADEVFGNHEVQFSQDGNTVTVNARMKDQSSRWFRRRQNLQVRYEIAIPRRFNVDLKTFGGSITVPELTGEARGETSGGSLKFGRIAGPVWGRTFGGSITVEGATGGVEATTSGGSVHLGEIGGNASAQTFGGSITIKQAKGSATAKTSGGGIEITGADGEIFAQTFGGSIVVGKGGGKVTAKTSGGNITIEQAAGRVEANTFGGSITAGVVAQPDDACRLETSGGSIHVRLASAIAVDLDASTSGGHVQADLPVTVQGKQNRGVLQGKINGGGKLLKLQTHGGSIYVEKL